MTKNVFSLHLSRDPTKAALFDSKRNAEKAGRALKATCGKGFTIVQVPLTGAFYVSFIDGQVLEAREQ